MEKVTLAVVNQKLDSLVTLVHDNTKRYDDLFNKIFFDNGNPSVFTRLQLLEESSLRHSKYATLIISTALTIRGSVILYFVTT